MADFLRSLGLGWLLGGDRSALVRNIRVIPVLVGGAAIPRAEELPEDLQALGDARPTN